jgi:propanediol dehydratase large subunit
MVKVKVVGDYGKDSMILINESCIVSVEKIGADNYNMYMSDGRMFRMTESMYEENFKELEPDEDEEECDDCRIGLTI